MKKYTVPQLVDKICELEAYEEYLVGIINTVRFSELKKDKYDQLRSTRRQLNSLRWRLEHDGGDR